MNRFLVSIIGFVLLLLISVAVIYWAPSRDEGDSAETETALQQGIAMFDQKEFKQALQHFQDLAKVEHDDWRVHYYLGSSQIMLKDYQAASTTLEKALVLQPDEVGTMYALGVAYYKQGNLKMAKAYFGAVLDINPNDQHAKGLMDTMSKLEQNSVNLEGGGGEVREEKPQSGS